MSSIVSQHIQLAKSQEQPHQPLFEKVEWLTVNDTQQEYSQATSLLETGSVGNSQKWIDYEKSMLRIPLIITLSNKTGNALTEAHVELNRVGFKQSFLSLINSITVDLNGSSLVQQNSLCDIYNNFKLLSTFSYNDLSTKASHIGFYPDVADVNTLTNGSESNSGQNNTGHYKRMSFINWFEGDATGAGATLNSNYISGDHLAQLYHSSVSRTDGSPTYTYSVSAIVMLKHLHPVFEAMPISKSLNFKIQIFYNHTRLTLGHNNAANVVYSSYQGTNPLMMTVGADNAVGNGAEIEASVYVGDTCLQAQAGQQQGRVGKSVELHLASYQMRPDVEENYISQNLVKTVKYEDYYQYSIQNVASGQPLNKLLSNGVSNLKSVLVVPYSATQPENQGSFADGLPHKFSHISNFNCLVGGASVLPQNARYTYQSFVEQFHTSFGVNSQESMGLSSGLIDYKTWVARPFYYLNLASVPEELQKSARSVALQGTNQSNQTVSYIVFISYERSFNLNTITGEITPAV